MTISKFRVLSIFLLLMAGCESTPRKPAAQTTAMQPFAHRSEKVVIRELDPYIMAQNYPEHFFLINPKGANEYEVELKTDFFSKVLRWQKPAATAKSPVQNQPYLDAMVSCDAPFEFKDENSRTPHPGPAQVHFRLLDSGFIEQHVSLIPSDQVTECRLFLKNPDQPKVIYGVRLITSDEGEPSRAAASIADP